MPVSRTRKKPKKENRSLYSRSQVHTDGMWKLYRAAFRAQNSKSISIALARLPEEFRRYGQTYSGAAAATLLIQGHRALEKLFYELSQECDPYEWLWYLRRTPLDLVAGTLESTAPYDLTFAETAASLSAKEPTPWVENKGLFSYPLSDERLTRVAHLVQTAQIMCKIQRQFRRVGKGQFIRITTESVLPELIQNPVIGQAIELFDQRMGVDDDFDARSGAVILSGGQPESKAPRFLVAYRKPKGWTKTPAILDGAGGRPLLPARLACAAISLGDTSSMFSLLTNLAQDERSWMTDEAIACFAALIGLAQYVLTDPNYMMTAEATGYIVLPRAGFMDALSDGLQQLLYFWPECGETYSLANVGILFTALEESQVTLFPWSAGRAMHQIDEDKILIDLISTCRRLPSLVTIPSSLGGSAVNHRAFHFEDSVQEVIDATCWKPDGPLRLYKAKTLRVAGNSITDIDAIGSHDGTLLLVSAKSIPYTAEYDAGVHNSIRNAETTVVSAIEKWKSVVTLIETTPRGDNYDFSNFERVLGVVVTPRIVYTVESRATASIGKKAGNTLYAASSLGELKRYLQSVSNNSDIETEAR